MTRTRSKEEFGTTQSDPSGDTESTGSGVELRPLETSAELEACILLQRRIWGIDYGDIVPASLLKVSQKVGGVAVGAFVDGEAAGFVFGITGVRDGRLTHWSHMLGVLKEHRGRGLGKRLKLFQRRWLVDRGVMEMRWTFDPLVASNAHFNLNQLRVDIQSYVPEMYNDTGSGLHSFGTDRFIVRWDLSRPLPDEPPEAARAVAWADTAVLASDAAEGGMDQGSSERPAEAVRIEIPHRIMSVNSTDHERAMAWRRATRRAFLDAWREGYRVVGFGRAETEGRCHYRLLRQNGDPEHAAPEHTAQEHAE